MAQSLATVSVVLVPRDADRTVGIRVVDSTGDRVLAWVAPGNILEGTVTPVAERLIGRCADAAKKVEHLKKSYVGKKFLLGTCDSVSFTAEAARALCEISIPTEESLLQAFIRHSVVKTMKAGKVESNDLVFTNYVYISKDDEPLFVRLDRKPSYVTVRGMICVVEAHAKVAKDTIALNGPQRDFGKIALGEPLEVAAYSPPEDRVYQLDTISFDVDNAIKGRVTNDMLDAAALERHMQAHFNRQFFVRGQKIIFTFADVPIVAEAVTMNLIAVPDSGDAAGPAAAAAAAGAVAGASADRGMIGNNTVVKINKRTGSTLKIKSAEDESGMRLNVLLQPGFSFEKLGIGGLDQEFSDIFRRAFASRVFPKDIIRKLGISHVKGLMLYGPPGCGKTLIARQISKLLKAKDVQLVNGPEVLSKYVGQAAENVRKLFEKAEAEYRERGDDSDLHIVIFDEIDAICKQRGSTSDNTGTGDQVVNQLLSKMDGVESLNNVLVIGMTNRLDLIDEALLRPGRFEIHMEIGLPSEPGRLQILRIHTTPMRDSGLMDAAVDLSELATLTKNYSGAELAGVVRSASAFAMHAKLDMSNLQKKIDTNIRVSMDDFRHALQEVKPAFGIDQDDFATTRPFGIIQYGPEFQTLYTRGINFVEQMRDATTTSLLTVLLSGESGTGKTALASTLALESGFPYVKLLSPDLLLDYSEQGKCHKIHKVFEDAYKTPLSIIVIDDIEGLMEYVDSGPRFSNAIRQTLTVLLKKNPPPGRKLLVFGTTSNERKLRMQQLGVAECFDFVLHVPVLRTVEAITATFKHSGKVAGSETELAVAAETVLNMNDGGIDVRRLLKTIDLLARRSGTVNATAVAEEFTSRVATSIAEMKTA